MILYAKMFLEDKRRAFRSPCVCVAHAHAFTCVHARAFHGDGSTESSNPRSDSFIAIGKISKS